MIYTRIVSSGNACKIQQPFFHNGLCAVLANDSSQEREWPKYHLFCRRIKTVPKDKGSSLMYAGDYPQT